MIRLMAYSTVTNVVKFGDRITIYFDNECIQGELNKYKYQ